MPIYNHRITQTLTILCAVLLPYAQQNSHSDQTLQVVIDVKPARSGDTLPACIVPLMSTIGRPNWDVAFVEGVLGHAFHFEMKEGGKHVMHDHMDWGSALGYLPSKFGQAQKFGAKKKSKDVDLVALKKEARDAVRASLDRGIPALAWQPMSMEMKKNHHHAYCWGLIVGYNEKDETYTVRHPFVADTYAVKYDAIGHADPAEWFNIRIFAPQEEPDAQKMHHKALRMAVKSSVNDGKGETTHGLAAYELWQKAFDSPDVPLEPSRHHTETLKQRRESAAAYIRKLIPIFPEATTLLQASATHYDQELEALNPLYDLLTSAKKQNRITSEERIKASHLINKALVAERAAIANIENALALLTKEDQ
jgi:hypothetical protein